MRKLAFIFDTVMLHDENDNYYELNLNYNLWKDRYLPVFDEIIVSARVKDMKHSEIVKKRGYTISNGDSVRIVPVTDYNIVTDVFTKRKKILRQLENIINQADCVIIRMPSPLSDLACDLCRKKNKKYAIEMVACAWDGYMHHGHWAGPIVAPYMYFRTKRQCHKATRVLYVTSKFLQNRYPTSGKTINASNVIINDTNVDVLEKRIEKIKNSDNNSYILGMVGTLELESKGHIIALKALKLLKEDYPNIKFEILGKGEGKKLRQKIEKLGLNKNVILKGTLPSGDPVLQWMDNIDILVIPSFQEGLPRVLIEAMSRACPAVGSNAGGIPELIDSRVIHKKGNYRKLYQDLKLIIENRDITIELAKQNFQNAKQYTKSKLDKKRKMFWINFRDNEK